MVKPDEGEIIWEGQKVAIQNPGHAQRLGIGMVFQHFSLFEALTVQENIALGLGSAEERVGLHERIIRISNEYGLPLDPNRVVHDLSVGERQRIEIVRCLLQNPKLLIMDEPTSVLTPSEVQKLFVTLRRLASEGCSILYISHKLEEVRALCSAATIMRLGKNVARVIPAEKTVKELAEIMINMDLRRADAAAAGTELGTAATGARQADNPVTVSFRNRSQRYFAVVEGRGDSGDRRHRRQRTERTDGRVVGRNCRRPAGKHHDRRRASGAYGAA